MHYRLLPLVALVILIGCGGGSDGPGPSPSPTPTPTPSTYTLTGTVTNQETGDGIVGATVTVVDGANAGKAATTTGGGSFSLTGLQPGGFTVRARAQYFNENSVGVTVTGNTSTSVALRPIPLFTRSGTGDTVFDMPPHVTRIRITGRYTRNSSNFIVRIAGRLIVNELLGTGWSMTTFEGTYLTAGGVVQIVSSSGVQWTFTEVR